MKTILLPTDFKKHSEKALEFAIRIAQQTNAKIIVTHSFFIPVMDIYVPAEAYQEAYDQVKTETQDHLSIYCQRIAKYNYSDGTPVNSEQIAAYDLAVPEILDIVRKRKIDLVIMGAECDDKTLSLIGSNVLEVLHNVDCPLLVVHEDTVYKDFKEMYVGLEDVSKELPKITQLIPIARAYETNITLFHIDKLPLAIDELSDLWESRKYHSFILEDIKKDYEYPAINFQYNLSDETYAKIDDVLAKHLPDLLVLVYQKRSWIERLFHRSVIKELLRKKKTPLLIIH